MSSDEDPAKPSKGLGYAIIAQVVMIFELAVMVDIETEQWNGMVTVVFTVLGILCLFQVVGIALVLKGHYRLGGIFQIVANVPHILDGFGILGIFGGSYAMDYAKISTERPRDGLVE